MDCATAIDCMCQLHPEKADVLRAAGYNLYFITNTNDLDYDTIMRNPPVLHDFKGGLASHLDRLLIPIPASISCCWTATA